MNWMLNFVQESSVQALDHVFFSEGSMVLHIRIHKCPELPYMEYNKATFLLRVMVAFIEGRPSGALSIGAKLSGQLFSIRL